MIGWNASTLLGGKTDGLEKRLPRAEIQNNLPDLVLLDGPLDLHPLTAGAHRHATIRGDSPRDRWRCLAPGQAR